MTDKLSQSIIHYSITKLYAESEILLLTSVLFLRLQTSCKVNVYVGYMSL